MSETQTVVVTGGADSVGRVMAEKFLARGDRVHICDVREDALAATLAANPGMRGTPANVGRPAEVERLFAEALGWMGHVDVLVNNVGIAPPRPEGFLAVTDEMWHATWNLNLMAAVRTIRAALPPMLAAGGGSIVNVASVNARLPDPLVIDYSAAKGALVNVAKSLSKEFGGRGIRVNSVDPGPVATDLWLGPDGVAARVGAASGRRPEDVAAGAAAGMVTGRFTTPQEVADLVLFLASVRSGNVTGSDYAIDGGLVTSL
jgi:NAD(P)-dependent dehydrogenase (short-subunit alcohol dehydrogenase family)